MTSISTVAPRNSIAMKLLKVVFSFYFVLTLTVTGIHMVSEYFNTKHNVIFEMEVIAQNFAPGLSQAIWDMNTEQLLPISLGIVNFPSVIGVQLKDEIGNEIRASGVISENGEIYHVEPDGTRILLERFTGLFQYSVPLTHERRGKHIPLGEVTIYSSNGVVFEEIQLGFTFITINAVIKTVALWLLFLWISRRLLSQPLASLTEATKRLTLDQLENFKLDVKTKGQNELKVLENAFHTMVQKLLQSRNQLHASQKRLELLLEGSHQIAEANDKVQAIIQTSKYILLSFASKASHKLQFGFPAKKEEHVKGYKNFQMELSLDKLVSVSPELYSSQKASPSHPMQINFSDTSPPFVSKHLQSSDSQFSSASFLDNQINLVILGKSEPLGYMQLTGIDQALLSAESQEYLDTLLQFLSMTLAEIDYTLDLEDKVRLRTRELDHKITLIKETQAQLVQSEKMASLGTLVAGVAHEINNPANFISFSTHNLSDDLKEFKTFIFEVAGDDADATFAKMFDEKFERFERWIKGLKEGAERIRIIVGDLRTFSRLDEAEQKKVNLAESLKSTLRMVKPQFKKIIEFECQFPIEPEIECWPSQLNQVFLNVMVNACQAIQMKNPSVKDSILGTLMVSIAQQGRHILIRFEDNGIGMTEEVKNKMFDPFFTTKEPGEGTGMGMSISFGIIEKHKGHLEVESTPGKGTTLSIFLPLTS